MAKSTISQVIELLLEKGIDMKKIDRYDTNNTVKSSTDIPVIINSMLRSHTFRAHKCPQTVIGAKGKIKNICKPCMFKNVLHKVKRFPDIKEPNMEGAVVQNLIFYLNKFWNIVFGGIFENEPEQIVSCNIPKQQRQTKIRAQVRGKKVDGERRIGSDHHIVENKRSSTHENRTANIQMVQQFDIGISRRQRRFFNEQI